MLGAYQIHPAAFPQQILCNLDLKDLLFILQLLNYQFEREGLFIIVVNWNRHDEFIPKDPAGGTPALPADPETSSG